MKKLWKKLLPIVMALFMPFFLSVPAQASGADSTADPAMLENGVEVTEDTVITGDQAQPIIVAAAGIKVSVEDATLAGLVVDPRAEGAEISISGVSDVAVLVVMAPKAAVSAETGTALGSVSVLSREVSLSVAGTAVSIVVTETAQGTAIIVAETAKVETLTVDAACVTVEVKGEAAAVKLTENAAGFKINAAAGAAVGAVTAPESVKASMEITGEGAEKLPEVEVLETSAEKPGKDPAAPSMPSPAPSIPPTAPPQSPGEEGTGNSIGITDVVEKESGCLTVTYEVDVEGNITNYYIKWSVDSDAGNIASGAAYGRGQDDGDGIFTLGENQFTVSVGFEGEVPVYGQYTVFIELVKTDDNGDVTTGKIVGFQEVEINYSEEALTFEDITYRAPDVDEDDENNDGTGDETGDESGDETDDETGDETDDETGDKTGDETDDETGDKTGGETDNETGDETGNETDDKTGDETGDETDDETGSNNDGETDDFAPGETGGEIGGNYGGDAGGNYGGETGGNYGDDASGDYGGDAGDNYGGEIQPSGENI